MYMLGCKRLTDKVKLQIHPIEIDHIETTLEVGMYAPCADIYRYEPRRRTPENIFKIVPVKQLQKEILKWKSSGKLYIVQKNEPGMEVRIGVEVAIVLFEICQISRSSQLERLKGNIALHLADNFNIHLTEMTRKSTPENDDDYSFFFDEF